VVINSSFARTYFPNQSPLGQHLQVAQRRLLALRLQIAGKLGDGTLGPPLCVLMEGWDAGGKGGARDHPYIRTVSWVNDIRYASPIVYQELSMIPAAAGFLLLTLRRRGRGAVRAAVGPGSFAAGLATFGAYILVLAALARAPAASVAAVRESSVVIATVLAVPLLHERVRPARLVGAALVVVGVIVLAL